MAKKVKVALIYDFDGTLSTTDMQNYGLIPTFGMSCKTFWNKANTFGDQNMMEQITSSMYYTMVRRPRQVADPRTVFRLRQKHPVSRRRGKLV